MLEATQPFSPFWFSLGLLLVSAFAWTRPLTLTDFENRKLARNVSAQVFFTLLYIVLYIVLVAAFKAGGRLFGGVVSDAGWLGHVNTYVQTKSTQPASFAPLLALTTIGWFQSLPVLREVERTCLVYTYSARYMFSDVHELTEHLQNCAFKPTDAERASNRGVLERLNVILTDTNTARIDLPVVTHWRKVESLLRHLRAWTTAGKLVLTAQERRELDDAFTAHERKTALAFNIIRILDHLSRGRGGAEKLDEMSDLLARAKSGSAETRDAVAARIESVLEEDDGSASPSPQPIYLSSKQLSRFLGQVQSYFEEEYRILLRQVAELTAKCIVHSGDRAAERLREIKQAGFAGLGRVLPISFNRILWMFFAVLGASFLLFVARQWVSSASSGAERVDMQRTMMMAGFIALTTAFAAIVGAAVGSTRSLVQGRRTPWRAYLGAGLIAVTLFFITHGTRMMLTGGIERPPVPAITTITATTPETTAAAPSAATRMTPWVRPPSLLQSAPWAIVPFVVTLSICLLARLPGWPLISATQGASGKAPAPAASAASGDRGQPVPKRQAAAVLRNLGERTMDGLALGLAMVAAVAVVLKIAFPLASWLFPSSGIQLSQRMVEAMAQSFLPPSIALLQFAIGFFIGALILRDVRRAGHSRMVQTPAPRAPKVTLPRAAAQLPIPFPAQ